MIHDLSWSEKSVLLKINRRQFKCHPEESLPPLLLNRELLLERYHSHTEKCASCRQALKKIQQLKFWCGVFTILALASSPLFSFLVETKSILLVMAILLPKP